MFQKGNKVYRLLLKEKRAITGRQSNNVIMTDFFQNSGSHWGQCCPPQGTTGSICRHVWLSPLASVEGCS